MLNKREEVVIVGAGFAGLWAARTLAGSGLRVTLVDHHNYHTFQALLYQVATAGLEPESIAYPIRTALAPLEGVEFMMAKAFRIDPEKRLLITDATPVPYDYLILATGSVPATFDLPGVAENAFFLKTLEDGVDLRNHIMASFERATREKDEAARKRLLSFVVVGGGATGVEFAGALTELTRGPLKRDFPKLDFGEVSITLLEGDKALLPGMPARVQNYTLGRLRRMGVEVRLDTLVIKATGDHVMLKGGMAIPTETVVWTAGVRASPVPGLSGIRTNPNGTVPVLPTLQVDGHPAIYAVGDLASIRSNGLVLPMVAQVAIQSAVTAAGNILRQREGKTLAPFIYNDLGSMVVIGRNAAGAYIGGRAYTGFIAWIIWLLIHLYKLIGYRNRLLVLTNWAWDYIFYDRALRFIFPSTLPSRGKTEEEKTK